MLKIKHRALPAIGTLVAAALTAGCGDAGFDLRAERAAVHRVAKDYLTALHRKDATRACSLWAPEGQRRLVRAAQREGRVGERAGCEEVARSVLADPEFSKDFSLRASLVSAAMVTFTDKGEAEVGMEPPLPPLRKINGEWRFIDLARPSRQPVAGPGPQFPEG